MWSIKKSAALFAILLWAVAVMDAQTWTLVQNPGALCNALAACSVTTSATTAGNVLVFVSGVYQNNNDGGAPAYSSVSGDSGLTHCPSAYAYNNYSTNHWMAEDCAYAVSAVGGATTFTFTWSNVNGDIDVWLLEYHLSAGVAAYDTSNNGGNNTAQCSSCTAPSLSPAGANDLIVQLSANTSGCTGIGAPYSNPFLTENSNIAADVAGALGVSSYSAPTWTGCSSGYGALGALAIKPASGSKTCTLRTMGAGPC